MVRLKINANEAEQDRLRDAHDELMAELAKVDLAIDNTEEAVGPQEAARWIDSARAQLRRDR